jgi:hypothetical protein
MRLLVCGGRDFSDTESAYKVLDAMHRALGIDVVIEGDARGADRIAGYWARRNRVDNLKFPADWSKHGKAAGPIRNQQMLVEAKPTHVLAFPGGRGTADMVGRARAAGVQIVIAQVDRSPKGQDRETGLGRDDESAVPQGCAKPIAQPIDTESKP